MAYCKGLFYGDVRHRSSEVRTEPTRNRSFKNRKFDSRKRSRSTLCDGKRRINTWQRFTRLLFLTSAIDKICITEVAGRQCLFFSLRGTLQSPVPSRVVWNSLPVVLQIASLTRAVIVIIHTPRVIMIFTTQRATIR